MKKYKLSKKQTQTETLELKNTMTELENSAESFKSQFNHAEESVT